VLAKSRNWVKLESTSDLRGDTLSGSPLGWGSGYLSRQVSVELVVSPLCGTSETLAAMLLACIRGGSLKHCILDYCTSINLFAELSGITTDPPPR